MVVRMTRVGSAHARAADRRYVNPMTAEHEQDQIPSGTGPIVEADPDVRRYDLVALERALVNVARQLGHPGIARLEQAERRSTRPPLRAVTARTGSGTMYDLASTRPLC